jgi:hypothetical protein
MKKLKKLIVEKKMTENGYKIYNMETNTLEPDLDREIEPSYRLIDRLEEIILGEIAKIDDAVFMEGKPLTTADLEKLCELNNMEDVLEAWRNAVTTIGEASIQKWRSRLAHIKQMQYADDPKRVFNLLVRGVTPMCDIKPNVLEEFFSNRWNR